MVFLLSVNEYLFIASLILIFSITGIIIFKVLSRPSIARRIAGPGSALISNFANPPIVMFALTVALMGAALWENYSTAAKAIREESQALYSYARLAENLPELAQFGLADYAKNYARSVVEDEWSQMAHGDLSDLTEEKFTALQVATFHAADTIRNKTSVQTLIADIDRINNARYARLGVSVRINDSIRWYSILLLALAVQIGVAMDYASRPKAMRTGLMIATITILIAICSIGTTLSNPYTGIVEISNELYTYVYTPATSSP